jgi:hypothetical protein
MQYTFQDGLCQERRIPLQDLYYLEHTPLVSIDQKGYFSIAFGIDGERMQASGVCPMVLDLKEGEHACARRGADRVEPGRKNFSARKRYVSGCYDLTYRYRYKNTALLWYPQPLQWFLLL